MILGISLTFLWAFLVSIYAVPSIIYVARTKGLLDMPNHRTVHEMLTPRLGGIAIFAGFVSAVTIFGDMDKGVQQLIAGCLVIFFVGIKDDIVTVSVFKKFFLQVLATGIVMFMADVHLTSFQGLFGVYELEANLSYPFTFFVIIGITNAINLIDGLDGLAGSIVLTISVTFGLYFIQFESPYAFVAFGLAGSIIGFLRYNFFKASIFMGDTGSLVCGFIISIMAIEFVELETVDSAPAIAIAILIIPIFDTLRVFMLRVLKGISPFTPDKNHIHHRLLSLNLSQISVVSVLVIMNLLVIGIARWFSFAGSTLIICAMVILGLLVTIILEFRSKYIRL